MTESTPDSGPDSGTNGRATFVLLALWLMVLATSSQVMIVAPILPRIARALGTRTEVLGALTAGYALALAVVAIVSGPISDRVGRRRILLWGTGAMTFALALHVFAASFPMLLALRILAGCAGGMLTGSALSYVGDAFPYERRGWASGWVMSGFAVGQIVGIPAGALLADAFGFRAPFALFALVMATSFTLIAIVVPEPAAERQTEPFTFANVGHVYLSFVRQREIAGAALAYAAMFFAVSTFVVFLPAWAEVTLGMDATDMAVMFCVGGLANVLIGPRAGRLSDRVGRKPLIVSSCAATSALFVAFTFVVDAPVLLHASFAFSMVLLALRMSPFQALLTALVPGNRRGTLMSFVVAIGQLGGGLGSGVASYVYAHAGYRGCTLFAAGAIAITGLLVAWLLPEPRHVPSDGASEPHA